MGDEMTERICRGCDLPATDLTIIEDDSEYCTLCEWDNVPYIDGLKAEIARLQGVIDTAWDAGGSDAFDILEKGISAVLLDKEKSDGS
ncbi:hypothetical protein LCGC14_1016150 [marine sediment metagenome]|uniref:Uncharacterized protein n=1 Tax=marine sediment metagenome TaxID=412755 RepID=A0A0F9R4S2_9ZZZZ